MGIHLLVAISGRGDPISEALDLYHSGQLEDARRLFEGAAKNGSAEAHFQLTYRYTLPAGQDVFHVREAARAGHAKAMASAFDRFLFRSVTRGPADPQGLWSLYQEGLLVNPNLMQEQDAPAKEYVEVVRLCAELPSFDLEGFLSKHEIRKPGEREHRPYWIWELAEEASRGGRFGSPDPERTLQLIVHGAAVPGELMAAVKVFYAHWKDGRVDVFNLCDFVTSGWGAQYCADRVYRNMDREVERFFRELADGMGAGGEIHVAQAVESADTYFRARAVHEIGTTAGGSWRGLRLEQTHREFREEWVDILQRISEGYTPLPDLQAWPSDQEVEHEQTTTHRWLEERKEYLDILGLRYEGTLQAEKDWRAHRRDFLALCQALRPEVEPEIWYGWINRRRIQALEECREFIRAFFPEDAPRNRRP